MFLTPDKFPIKLPHTLKITDEEIRKGDQNQCDTCPNSLAWMRDLPDEVDGRVVGVDTGGLQTEIILGAGTANTDRWVIQHLAELIDWILNFDRSECEPEKKPVEPIEFVIHSGHFSLS